MRLIDAKRIIHEHMNELHDKPCSISYHLNFNGGLMVHLNNVMRLSTEFFPNDENLASLALVHDIGKARIYKWIDDSFAYVSGSKDHALYTVDMIEESKYDLTEEEVVAIKMHHGGWAPFKDIQMNELAIKLHFVDNLSTIQEK